MKISKKNAEHYIWGQLCDGWHLVKQEELSIIHERMPPHTQEMRHFHQKARQFFFMLSGTAVLEVDGDQIQLHAHEGVEVPPHVPHQMKNCSEEEIEFLVISHPNARGDRVVVEVLDKI